LTSSHYHAIVAFVMTQVLPKIIAIVGPTASGKTKLAVALAKKYNGEIVSADSRQVYRGLDLGSGKDLEEYGRVPYHLIDVVSPKTTFTVAQYQKKAYRAIDDILKRGKLPILVGGSGLYIDAVAKGYQFGATHSKAETNKIRKKLAAKSLAWLLKELQRLDVPTYKTIDKANRVRVERAVERSLLNVGTVTMKPKYEIIWLGINPDREILRTKITKRLKQRIKQGLIAEVERLHQGGISWRRLESFGLEYRFTTQYLQGKLEYREMIKQLIIANYQFSRRQVTWFKRNKDIHWITNSKEASGLIK
jgi:tRNA dimethylallyltransferase